MFQTLAPLTTNNGICGAPEKAVTGVFLAVLCFVCFATAFTQRVAGTDDGKQHYVLLTPAACINKSLTTTSSARDEAAVKAAGNAGGQDLVHAGFSTLLLAVLALLTPPVTTCYYPHLADVIIKAVPPILALAVSGLMLMLRAPRAGVGLPGSAAAGGAPSYKPFDSQAPAADVEAPPAPKVQSSQSRASWRGGGLDDQNHKVRR